MLTTILYGLISGSTLFIGAIIGIYMKIPKYLSGVIMAFGSGVLVSALTFDLMDNAFDTGGFDSVAIGFLVGTLLFVIGDYLIDHAGGHNRKHIHSNIHVNKRLKMNKTNKVIFCRDQCIVIHFADASIISITYNQQFEIYTNSGSDIILDIIA